MKTRLFGTLAACLLACTAAWSADSKKAQPKPESETAYSDWMKVMTAKEAKQDQAQFDAVLSRGIKLLVKYPTSSRAGDVVRDLAAYPGNFLNTKNTAGQRGVYLSALRYQLVSAKTEPGVTDEAKVALAALDAATMDSDTRIQPSRDNIEQLREKIDALAAMPGSGRFLAAREQSYAEIIGRVSSPARQEAHLRKLTAHPEKSVADMARRDLDLIDLRKAPLELKFTGLDGKETDLAQLRGKVVAVYFWSSTNQGSTNGLGVLQEVHSFNRKAGFEVVTVAYDKAEDREKLVNYCKQNRMNFPVAHDGKGSKNELGQKLGISSVPRLVLLDKQGMILTHNLALNQLEPAVKQYTKAK